jgi:hypothetical protein
MVTSFSWWPFFIESSRPRTSLNKRERPEYAIQSSEMTGWPETRGESMAEPE